jgi:DNA polymerase III alpha subunit
MAWLKTHHPAAFACGILDHYGGDYPLRTVAADCARQGVELLPPDVQRSASSCALQGGAVRVGLAALKHLRERSRAALLALRPFADLPELLGRVPLAPAEVEALVLSGACDHLPPLAPEGYPFAHEEALARLRVALRPGGRTPAPTATREERARRALENLAPLRGRGSLAGTHALLARVLNELRFLGMHLSAHPMGVLRGEAARAGCVATSELGARAGERARVAGLVSASQRLETGGGRMQFVTLEDEEGLVEAVIPPGAFAALGDPIESPGPFLVSGRVSADGGDVRLVVEDVQPFHRRPRPYEPSPA